MREAEERLQQEVGTQTNKTAAAGLQSVVNSGGRHQLSSPLLSTMAEAARDQTSHGCPGTTAFAAATRMASN